MRFDEIYGAIIGLVVAVRRNGAKRSSRPIARFVNVPPHVRATMLKPLEKRIIASTLVCVGTPEWMTFTQL
jgi:hypothetical protein